MNPLKLSVLAITLSTLCLNVFADTQWTNPETGTIWKFGPYGGLGVPAGSTFVAKDIPIWDGKAWYFHGEQIGTNWAGEHGGYGITNYPYPPESITNLAVHAPRPWETATNFMIGSIMYCSNLYQPAQFEPQGQGITTNIVINDSYIGTVQLGTNCYNADYLRDIQFFLSLERATGRMEVHREIYKQKHDEPVHLETNWLGSPITGGDIDFPAKGMYGPRQKDDILLGLRSDGIVIWKQRDK